MSENTNQVHPAKVLRDSVEEVLTTQGGTTVLNRVKEHLVEEKLKERVNLILQGISKRDEVQRTIYKTKPDQAAYDANGQKIGESYSKAKVDELKKANEQLAKVDKALEDALSDKPNFENLKKLCGNDKGDADKKD